MDLKKSLITPPHDRPRTSQTNQVGKLTRDAKSSLRDEAYLARISQLPSVSNPSFWEGKAPQLPGLSRPSSPRPLAVHQQAATQYPGLERPVAPRCKGRLLERALIRKALRKPHPLSHATTLDSLAAEEGEADVSEDTEQTIVTFEYTKDAFAGSEVGPEKRDAVADLFAVPIESEAQSEKVGVATEDTKDTLATTEGSKARLEKGAASKDIQETSAATLARELQSGKAGVVSNMDSMNKAPKRKLSCITDDSHFDRANKKIRHLAQRILPNIPHLLSVPTKYPYSPTFPFENLRTPFEDWEVKHLQHMTLISYNVRGVAWVRGDWEDEINAYSPNNSGPRSGTATPHSERDPSKPRTKMSLADYKAGKRPATSSQSAAANCTQRPKSSSIPSVPTVSPTQHMIDQIVESHTVDGRDPNAERRGGAQSWKADPRYVPPQQQPKVSNAKDGKRVAETIISTRPEKRAMLDQNNTQKPSQRDEPTSRAKPILDPAASNNSQKSGLAQEKTAGVKQRDTPIPGKENEKPVNGPKKEKTKLEQGPSREQRQNLSVEKRRQKPGASPEKDRETLENGLEKGLRLETVTQKEKQKPVVRSRDTTKAKAEDPMDVLPPLLSPLPPPFDKPQTNFDDIVGASTGMDKSIGVTPPSSADDMPPLLSPIPKEIFDKLTREAELAITRYQEGERKKLESQKCQAEMEAANVATVEQSKNTNTVESRRERSRQSDAPGVARKTTKLSTSKPRKLKKSDEVPDGMEGADTSLIVKLKYKKRNARNIERLLNTKPHPASESQPLSRSVDKKRAHPSDDDAEPSAKRKKAPATLEASKAHTPRNAFKSPAPSTSPLSQKGPLETPRKYDAGKSVAMRKIDSSDGRARTPQGPSPSVPSAPPSTEKARASINAAESEAQKASFDKYLSLGKAIKRQADSLLRSKEKEANRGLISEEDKRLGTVVTIESVIAFMLGFNAFDRHRQIERKLTVAEHWSGVIPLLSFATDKARTYPQLYTLTLLLNVVSRESLDRIYTEHLSAETPSKEPVYLKLREDLIQNSKARRNVLQQYIEQKRVASVDFVLSVADAKAVAMSVLGQFCAENQVGWTPKI